MLDVKLHNRLPYRLGCLHVCMFVSECIRKSVSSDDILPDDQSDFLCFFTPASSVIKSQ